MLFGIYIWIYKCFVLIISGKLETQRINWNLIECFSYHPGRIDPCRMVQFLVCKCNNPVETLLPWMGALGLQKCSGSTQASRSVLWGLLGSAVLHTSIALTVIYSPHSCLQRTVYPGVRVFNENQRIHTHPSIWCIKKCDSLKHTTFFYFSIVQL